jgi:hypothetical protein
MTHARYPSETDATIMRHGARLVDRSPFGGLVLGSCQIVLDAVKGR